mmetsp:Transcript_39110/g.54314  ORF Transcript_39110/g.54314 Transcript_39110/m.54314 type:complete len:201 (+) Transcript_39110:848-1450(+)
MVQTPAWPRKSMLVITITLLHSKSACVSLTRRWSITRTWPRCTLVTTSLLTFTDGFSPSMTMLLWELGLSLIRRRLSSIRMLFASAPRTSVVTGRSSEWKPIPSPSTLDLAACKIASPWLVMPLGTLLSAPVREYISPLSLDACVQRRLWSSPKAVPSRLTKATCEFISTNGIESIGPLTKYWTFFRRSSIVPTPPVKPL